MVIVGLMGLGLFATAASVVKIFLIKSYANSTDPLWDIVSLGLWGYVEQFAGLIAACVPCLKAPFERFLRRVGLLSTIGGSEPSAKSMHGHGNLYSPKADLDHCESAVAMTTMISTHSHEAKGYHIREDVQSEASILSADAGYYDTVEDHSRMHTKRFFRAK
jgi:hypothetical protein